ncbi:hypothetical protein [Thauera butanivorans]|jgi:uncharacterized membrane protein YwaF|uniref:hypothetical protein n=1 Tax=Thauera butanivorans TaxID=86174 RepID=UPI0008391290|nr:hypothetical protein [Thauera butanivorans]
MRTAIIILLGLAATAITLWFTPSAQRKIAAALFTVAWLAVTLLNLRTGLSHGYTLAQELPIHLVLFGVPVITFWVLVLLKKG